MRFHSSYSIPEFIDPHSTPKNSYPWSLPCLGIPIPGVCRV
ncbi:hypothetical protein T05_4134 [Trichinella murrelli]|uniref:Uncharacterized protein n=1 Tax=Trichinella murrelli TaxID=144512 RepID=A0A0V0SYC8_9BILA|nr:hypothetical protein T05_4134 [Trichinella murrelli]